MKFSINRTVLMKHLADVQLAVASKSTIPILTGLKVELTHQALILVASDADISIEITIEANEETALDIQQTGSIVIQPAKMLVDIIRKLPDERVHIEVKDAKQVAIKSDTSSFMIAGIDASEYPHLPEIDQTAPIQLPVPLLKRLIKQTVFAVSHHESRPILTGVHFMIDSQGLKAVATDTHRLAKHKVDLDTGLDQTYSFVVPGKSLAELNRLMGEDDEHIDLFIAQNQVLFSLGQIDFYSRLLEGNYPDTDQLIPSDTQTSIRLQAKDLQAAVDRASLLSHAGKNNIIKLIVEANRFEINGNYPDIGKIEEEIPFQSIQGNDIQISFNPDYMKQALQAFGPVDVCIELVGPLRPFLLKPVEEEDHFIQLLTPIRTPS